MSRLWPIVSAAAAEVGDAAALAAVAATVGLVLDRVVDLASSAVEVGLAVRLECGNDQRW